MTKRIAKKASLLNYPKGKNKGAVPDLGYTSKAYRAYLWSRESLVSLRFADSLSSYKTTDFVVYSSTTVARIPEPQPYRRRTRDYTLSLEERKLLNETYLALHPPAYDARDIVNGVFDQIIHFPPYDE